jgi:hypothetical protein
MGVSKKYAMLSVTNRCIPHKAHLTKINLRLRSFVDLYQFCVYLCQSPEQIYSRIHGAPCTKTPMP